MTKLKLYIKIFLMSVLGFTSCQNGLNEKSDVIDDEEMVDVKLVIPSMPDFSNTRALDISQEANMSNLYVIAIRTASYDESGKTYTEIPAEKQVLNIYPLNPIGLSFETGGDYKDENSFNLTMYPGKYKFYVLANIDRYLDRFSRISDFVTEDQLKTLYLEYSTDRVLTPTHLPMACLPSEITASNDSDKNVEGEIIVTVNRGNAPTIYANMKFLCAKVRYTILFDKTSGGISESFGNTAIRFNVDYNSFTTASNLRKITYLFDHTWTQAEKDDCFVTTEEEYPTYPGGVETMSNRGYWIIDLGRYEFKSGEFFDSNYPKSPNDDRIKLFEGGVEEWKLKEQRVWQGVCYLPENNDNDIAKTILCFPYAIDVIKDGVCKDGDWLDSNFKMIYLFGNEGENQHQSSNGNDSNYGNPSSSDPAGSHGLVRGKMYDVVALVKSPDEGDFYVTVKTTVADWHDGGENHVTDSAISGN